MVTWPALAGVLALGVFVALPGDGGWRTWARPGVLFVPALVTIGFLTPALYAATLDGFEAGVADKVALLVLLLGLLAPQLALVAQVLRRRWLPAAATLVAALIGVGLIVAGDAASGYDAEHPRPDTLFYTLNADSGEAKWATLDPEPDQWTQQFLSGDAKRITVGELYGAAEARERDARPATAGGGGFRGVPDPGEQIVRVRRGRYAMSEARSRDA